MKKNALLLLMLAVALGGMIAETNWLTPSAATAEAKSAPPLPRRAMKAGDTFEIDAADLRARLDDCGEDERPEQIADWVVYANLLYARVPAGELRDSLYDRPPLRLPLLEESVNFDYGPGRRVVLADKSVWLFRSATDPHPAATLARLADQVRMELGTKPERFGVFTYRSTLTDGVIEVRKEPDIAAATMYSPGYGYVQATVRNVEELDQWLGQVDDVVHVREIGEQAVELGGRRMNDARTEGVGLEHVASLYQGHRRITQNHADYDPKPRLEALVKAAEGADGSEFRDVANRYADMLDGWAAQLEQRGYDVAELRLSRSAIAEAQSPESRVEIVKTAAGYTKTIFGQLHEAGLIMPPEPGFSLDPLWDGAGLVRDLRRLLDDPNSLVAEASAVATNGPRRQTDERPNIVWTAVDVTSTAGDGVPITEARRNEITAAIAKMQGKRDAELPKGPIVPLLDLRHELRESESEVPLAALINYIVSKNQCQCARYDGPMQGTLVGMNLFYTDLLAKLWASVDYRHAAPVDEVVGFRSNLRLLPNVERAFWKEMWAKPNTRLWFGPKKEGYARSQNGSEVNFAHVATRVYSAGSNPRKPGAEEAPAEDSRLVFHWWDRHYERIADYEQQYHTQNQIMKWSVITGWAAEKHLLGFLDTPSIRVRRDLRFNRWYVANDSLRFRGDVRMLPESRWRGGTECMEILRSYSVPSGGMPFTFIEGGVSLGGARTLGEEGAAVAESLGPALRRAGLTFEENAGLIRNFKATEFELPQGLARTIIKPKVGNFLRDGAAEFRVAKFETELTGGGSRVALRVAADGEELGALSFREAGKGVKLAWRDAPASYAERFTKYTAAVNDKAAPPLLRQNVYFIESKDGAVEAIVRTADDGAPRTFAVTKSDSLQKAFVQAGYGAEGEHRVGASFVDAAEANTRLDSQAWQRLHVADREWITRVFTNREPIPAATSFKIKSAAGVEIDAFVDGKTIWLRHPSGYPRFESLIEREGITPEYLQGLLTRKTGSVISTPAATASPGVRAASAAGRGELTDAMANLSEAAKQGSFDKALRDFGAHFGDEALHDLTGARPRLPHDYAWVKGSDADACIRKGLIAAHENNLAQAADELNHVAGAKVSESLLGNVRNMRAGADFDVIRDLVLADEHGATPVFMKLVKVRAEKYALHTSVEIDGHVRVIPVIDKGSVQRAVTDSGNVFYVDRKLLASYDWDGSPGASLHRALSDPNVVWEQLTIDGSGDFRPSLLVHEKQTFVAMKTAPAKTSLHPSADSAGQALRLRYRPCQQNDPRSDCKQM